MVTLQGQGIHGGKDASVTFVPDPGPLRIEVGGVASPLGDFEVEGALGSTSLRRAGATIHTVEHLFAALAGLGIRSDVRIVVTGDELPLLGGGALELARALAGLQITPRPPELVVVRGGVVRVDDSRYEFLPAQGVEVEVEVDLPSHCATRASWRGDARDFSTRIAPARTFALEGDIGELARRGLARHVDPASVVVVGSDALHAAGGSTPDEPARHKLLDLMGDAYAHGGPPRGALRAYRPGHARNHAAFRLAALEGILRREPI